MYSKRLRLGPMAALTLLLYAAPQIAEASCSYSARIYTPNWIRSPTKTTVCLDDGMVRLDGDKRRLDGVLDLGNGIIKRFSVVDSASGRITVNSVLNDYARGSAEHDQIAAYYHVKWTYERIAVTGYGPTHLPDRLTIDVRGDHKNAFFKSDEWRVSLGYHDNVNDGERYWYAADGEVVIHEVAHALLHTVQPNIMTVQGAMIHEPMRITSPAHTATTTVWVSTRRGCTTSFRPHPTAADGPALVT